MPSDTSFWASCCSSLPVLLTSETSNRVKETYPAGGSPSTLRHPIPHPSRPSWHCVRSAGTMPLSTERPLRTESSGRNAVLRFVRRDSPSNPKKRPSKWYGRHTGRHIGLLERFPTRLFTCRKRCESLNFDLGNDAYVMARSGQAPRTHINARQQPTRKDSPATASLVAPSRGRSTSPRYRLC